ncbi:hypothetical protein J1N35_033177 [Gossypium stocksii]|uniref:Uncharacterized protein n=1 Tax=Gossypium stocksii TaxID=47602 RepID=A0A9D3UPN0_9ROSI|nr:hypothetical protein J1N35_033177 [Gossypium stocksii]
MIRVIMGLGGRDGGYTGCGNQACGFRFMNEGGNRQERHIAGVCAKGLHLEGFASLSKELKCIMDVKYLMRNLQGRNASDVIGEGGGSSCKKERVLASFVSTEADSDDKVMDELKEDHHKKRKNRTTTWE